MRALFILLLSIIMMGMEAQAQLRAARGKVLNSEDRRPLAQVNISTAKGATARTNDRGAFELLVPSAGGKLTFSLVGYKTYIVETGNAGGDSILVLLSPLAETLTEVVISTGYEKLPKERATGSFTVIDNKTYNQQIGTGVLERLRYITNGVAAVPDRIRNLGTDAMLVRGMSTFTTAIQRPLVIVDNFEYQGDLNNINPNDVEQVSFLKDAAAGSIWGAKAANGVIVITTKKGRFNQPLRISLTTNITTASPPNLDYDRPISAADLIEMERFLFVQKFRFTDTARSNNPPFSQAYELLFAHKNGRLTSAGLESGLNGLAGKDVRDDFARYFYQRELNQQYALSMSGGSQAIAWNLGLGTDYNSSNLAATYRRSTIRFSNQVQLHQKLAFNIDGSFTSSASKSGRPAYGSIVLSTGSLPVYSSFAASNGSALPIYNNYRQGYIDNIGGGKLLDWRYYPLEDYKFVQTTGKLNDLNASSGLNYTLLPWLKADVKYRIARQWSGNGTMNTEQSYYNRGLINTFTQLNTSTGTVTYKVPRGAIYDSSEEVMTAQNLRAQLSLDRDFSVGEFHLLAGTEWSEKIAVGHTNRLYGYDSQTLSFTPVDVIDAYPSYMTGGTANIPFVDDQSALNNRFVSHYANASFVLLRRYTITASARRDASNLFGVATNARWNPFWSVGASWNVGSEKWLHTGALQELKLRGSYGLQGNIDPNKVAVTTISYANNNIYTQVPFSQVANYPNPDLRWEQVAMLNLGIDFRALKGKLSGSIEYYQKRMSDLYASVAVDRTTGISAGSVTRNIGRSIGHGWDIQLKAQQRMGEVNWKGDVILNTYTDKVTQLDKRSFTGREAMGSPFVILEGYSTSALFAFKWGGLNPANGDPMGYLNGMPSKDYSAITAQTRLEDTEYLGSQLPKLFGSVGSSFGYKGFELTARLTYKFDYFFRRNSIQYANLISQLSGHADYAKRWKQPGDEKFTDVPSFLYPANSARDEFYRNSSILYEPGDHIRLQYINVAYSLSRAANKWLPVQNLQLGIAANNLGLVWKASKSGLDPEAALFPRTAQVTFNMNLNF